MSRTKQASTMSKRICFRVNNLTASKLDVMSNFINLSDFMRQILEEYLIRENELYNQDSITLNQVEEVNR